MLDFTAVKSRSDAERVERLAALIWNEHYPPIIGQAQVDYMLATLQSADAVCAQIGAGYRYYFMRDEGAALGYFAVKPDGGVYRLDKFYLIHIARGRGMGKTCLSFIEQLGRDEGCSRLRLSVNKHNAASIDVYKRLGFTVVGEGVTDIGGGFSMDDYYMEKPL